MSLLNFFKPLPDTQRKNSRVKRPLQVQDEDVANAADKTNPTKKNRLELDLGQDQKWTKIKKENLDLDYTVLFSETEALNLMTRCESELVYNVGHLAKIRIFGKWIDIPRKQVAHGDTGLTYTFSGNTVPANPWMPLLLEIRDKITKVSGFTFNFVLINRYKDGNDYMGEHKDDEQDLCPDHPIASLSLGQPRDFIFKHQDSRGKNAKRRIETVSICLQNGSLLLMNSPTNKYWYHSLPRRTKALGTRINFTFRKMIPSKCRPMPVPTAGNSSSS